MATVEELKNFGASTPGGPKKETSNNLRQFDKLVNPGRAAGGSRVTDTFDNQIGGLNNVLNRANQDILTGDITTGQLTGAINTENEGTDLISSIQDIVDKRDKTSVEAAFSQAHASGSDEDILEASQDFLRLTELERATGSQRESEQLAQRQIIREQQANTQAQARVQERIGQVGLQTDQIGLQNSQLGLQSDQLGFQNDQLAMQSSQVQERVRQAQSEAQQQQAALINAGAQSGFSSSSSVQGSTGSLASRSALVSARGMEAVAMNTVATGLNASQIAQNNATTGVNNSAISLNTAALGNLATDFDILGQANQDLSDDSTRLSSSLVDNINFLNTTFDLGGNIGAANQSIMQQQANDQASAQERSQLMGSIMAGASLGGTFGGPMGAGIGIGVAVLADIFDF